MDPYSFFQYHSQSGSYATPLHHVDEHVSHDSRPNLSKNVSNFRLDHANHTTSNNAASLNATQPSSQDYLACQGFPDSTARRGCSEASLASSCIDANNNSAIQIKGAEISNKNEYVQENIPPASSMSDNQYSFSTKNMLGRYGSSSTQQPAKYSEATHPGTTEQRVRHGDFKASFMRSGSSFVPPVKSTQQYSSSQSNNIRGGYQREVVSSQRKPLAEFPQQLQAGYSSEHVDFEDNKPKDSLGINMNDRSALPLIRVTSINVNKDIQGPCMKNQSSTPTAADARGPAGPAAAMMTKHGNLRAVAELPPRFRSIFSEFPYFNVVQSTVFDCVYNSDDSVVVSAPTGSGKTVVMELAIIRAVMNCSCNTNKLKIVY
ncbi:uncharacterized protein LOC125178548, partial [Hyalella azteca]|uniref:Uncharacterized protein LOC125178548 n=1 Tax=Hyalella azteca TaxID=294128 RepID=A0A979FNA2_HYAAZ